MAHHQESLTGSPADRGIGTDCQPRSLLVSAKPMRARCIHSNQRSPSQRWRSSALTWLALLLAAMFTPHATFAQVDQGAITGVVTDSTGAVIRGAKVKLTAADTGLMLQMKSNQSGNYTFSPIKIGNYTVSVSVNGFQTLTRENLHVDAQQRLDVNLSLMVFINYPDVSWPDLPFGGVKRSGYGKELSNLGFEEFVNKKLVLVPNIPAESH
jgi:hypothetical protein